jgi:hypothetical protein
MPELSWSLISRLRLKRVFWLLVSWPARKARSVNQTEWMKAKKLVDARDEGQCLRCMGEANDVHHRLVRGMGGTADPAVNYGLANLISLCRKCHDWIHAHPEESYQSGFLVHSWDNPELTVLAGKDEKFWITLTAAGDMRLYTQMTLF